MGIKSPQDWLYISAHSVYLHRLISILAIFPPNPPLPELHPPYHSIASQVTLLFPLSQKNQNSHTNPKRRTKKYPFRSCALVQPSLGILNAISTTGLAMPSPHVPMYCSTHVCECKGCLEVPCRFRLVAVDLPIGWHFDDMNVEETSAEALRRVFDGSPRRVCSRCMSCAVLSTEV